MTQKAARKYLGEIERWAKAPDGTKVWCKIPGGDWCLTNAPIWALPITYYIVDDEWAELRKAQADGKQLQFKLYPNGKWRDGELSYPGMSIGKPEHWRIKPEGMKKLKR